MPQDELTPQEVKQLVIDALTTDNTLQYGLTENGKRNVTLNPRDILHVAAVIAMRLQGKKVAEL
jgi:hypothetical protein